MAFESFDNINQHELQAAIEAEINLFENSHSGHTYTNMEGIAFHPNLPHQQLMLLRLLLQNQSMLTLIRIL
jgi:hypothetical protein